VCGRSSRCPQAARTTSRRWWTRCVPWPSDTGALGFVSVDDDFFVIARVMGPSVRLLLSDVTAATEWELASGVIDLLDLPEPDDDVPVGAVVLVRDGEVVGPATTTGRATATRPRTPRCSRCAAAAAALGRGG
jgi:hypothetical protein